MNTGRPKTTSKIKRGNTWYIQFTNNNGKRIRASLKTKDECTADYRKNEIDRLLKHYVSKSEAIQSNIDPVVFNIIYQEEKPVEITSFVKVQTKAMPDDAEGFATYVASLINQNERLLNEVERLKHIEKELLALKKSESGMRITAINNSPTCEKALEDYVSDLENIAKHNRSTHFNKIREMLDYIGFEKLYEIDHNNIEDYLNHESKNNKKPAQRFNRIRLIVSRFFTWAHKKYNVVNHITKVSAKKTSVSEDIHWHTIKEIESVISPLDDYWSAVVAMLGYAGLSAHELRGLYLTDIFEKESKMMIRVQPHAERGVKTSHRPRNINIHETLLLPRLNKYLQKHNGSKFLFPSCVGGSEIWQPNTFSVHLNGRKASKGNNAMNGILPIGMDALSLRRAFGSNLLRSGKTAAEVSAAMGNSVLMIERHYARLIGDEVQIDF